ncbi:MAG: hypothetical protein BGO39_03570 [Chloroflexi bacterium 54-19]|nr:MAG: hypothetical protein BGO39_03570 [Chloroflexi bacterium 54-19]
MSRLISLQDPTATDQNTGIMENYAHLGLLDNPFPVDGIINPASPDPRVNGTIFEPGIRRGVILDFESKLLGVSNPEQRYRMGYLWAQGDQAFGRGVGKTAILLHLMRSINRNWGETYFKGKFPVCALYVYPPQNMNRLEYLAVLAMCELVALGVINSAVTNLRYRVIMESNWPEDQVERVRNLRLEEGKKLLSNDWLISNGFDLKALEDLVIALLVSNNVEADFARAIAANDLLGYLKSMRKDGLLDFPPPPRDLALYRKANNLFFTQTLRTLKIAGFKGVYLFVDDIENMIDKMGRRERETFTKELGYILLRGDYEAGISRFLTLVLTTHAAAAQRLSEAWGLAGLQSSLPMSLDAPNSILVPLLDLNEAKEVVKRHLNHYRKDKSQPENPAEIFKPFTEEAVELLVQQCNYHPREFLSKAHFTIERAKQEDSRTLIDKAFIEASLLDTNSIRAGLNEAIDISLL